MAHILLSSSAVRVHDLQAYKKMDVTRERINHILKLRKMLLSIKDLKLVTVSSFCPFTLISVLLPLVLFVISLVFSALIAMP